MSVLDLKEAALQLSGRQTNKFAKRVRPVSGYVNSVARDQSGYVTHASVQIMTPDGYSSAVSVPVPPGMNAYPGQTVSVQNTGSPSFANWSLAGATYTVAANAGIIMDASGSTSGEFSSIWITGDGTLTVGGTKQDGEIQGAQVVIDHNALIGQDDDGRDMIRLYWNNAEYPAGTSIYGPDDGGNILIDPEQQLFLIRDGQDEVMRFGKGSSRILGALWIGDEPGPQVGLGIIDGDATMTARNRSGVPEFSVRIGSDQENVHVHIGKPKPSPGYLEFENGMLTVDGRIAARDFVLLGNGEIAEAASLTVSGKVTVGSGNDAAILDGENPDWRIYVGSAVPEQAPFRVNKSGDVWLRNITASNAVFFENVYMGGWGIGNETIIGNGDDLVADDGEYVAGSGEYLISNHEGVILDGGTDRISILNSSFGAAGVQLEWNTGAPRVYIGDGSDQYLRWEDNNLSWRGLKTELTIDGVFKADDAIITGEVWTSSGGVGAFSITAYGLSAGSLRMRGDVPDIEMDLATAFNTGSGFWMGKDSVDNEYKLRIGRTPADGYGYLAWDGSTLTIDADHLGGTINRSVKFGISGHIEMDQAVAYDTGLGFWVGDDSGTYKLRIGRPPADGYGYLAWNGSTLIVNANNLGGTVNQGIDIGTAGYVKGGASGYNNGTGFWLGYSGAYKFFIGNSGGSKLTWDGSSLSVRGVITAEQALSHTGSTLGFFGVTPASRPAAYSFSNGSIDRAINCSSTTVTELANVVYTMWSDLKSLGILA